MEAPGDAAPAAPVVAAPAADDEIETPIAPAAVADTVPATTLTTTTATTAVAAVACFCRAGGRDAGAAGVSAEAEQPVIVIVGGAATGILIAIKRLDMADGERLLEAEAHPEKESGMRAVTSDALEEFRANCRRPGVALTTASIMTASALTFTSSAITSVKRARAPNVNSSGDIETNTATSAAAAFAGIGMVHITAPAIPV
jgi:hypothetical protein